MKTLDRPIITDIRGANRGHEQMRLALCKHIDLPPLVGQVTDVTLGRAQAAAALWNEGGHCLVPVTADARIQPFSKDTDLALLLTDDPGLQLNMLHDSPANVVTVGIMLASPIGLAAGGRVLGFGAVIPRSDEAIRRQGLMLFQRFACMSGGKRTASRAVRAPLANWAQVEPLRRLLYRELAQETHDVLVGQRSVGRLIVTVSNPNPVAHTLDVLPRGDQSLDSLRSAAKGRKQAVAYFDHSRPDWLCALLPTRSGYPHMVELPEPFGFSELRDAAFRPVESSASDYPDFTD